MTPTRKGLAFGMGLLLGYGAVQWRDQIAETNAVIAEGSKSSYDHCMKMNEVFAEMPSLSQQRDCDAEFLENANG